MTIRRHKPKQASTPPVAPAAAGFPPARRAPEPGREWQPGELITPAVAADRLSVTAKVLERWRGTGDGPVFVRLTSKTIRYRPEDLDAFVAGRTRASTAAG